MLITGSILMASLESRALHQRQRSCQYVKENKHWFLLLKKGISSLGIATATKVENTIQGLQYFFFQSIINIHTSIGSRDVSIYNYPFSGGSITKKQGHFATLSRLAPEV